LGQSSYKGGTPGNDVIYGNDSANVIHGIGGNDIIKGRGGNDRVYGGDGHDNVYGDKGNDQVGGDFDDDSLFGGVGDDRLNGGYGENLFDLGPGNDTVTGGGKYDVLSFRNSPTAVKVNLRVGTATGQGNDTLRGIFGELSGSSRDDTLLGAPGPAYDDLFIRGGAGPDWIDLNGAWCCAAFGEEGDDVIFGSPSNAGENGEYLNGGEGSMNLMV
jgi:Ca2+-binding RTX toxin-like protein